MLDKIRNRVIAPDTTLIQAMKAMDAAGVKILFVFEGEKFLGIFTIGDIQRAVIAGHPLSAPVSLVLDKDKVYAYTFDEDDSIRDKMRRLRAECMPVLDGNGYLVDVLFWKDVFPSPIPKKRAPVGIPVVIMAGGEGVRLRPLTNVIPKPLVPIGEKTVLEEIMDRFISAGCSEFFVSLGYKADMIKYYMSSKDYSVRYFKEEKPLGTIGGVSLLKGMVDTPFFVSNCDNLIDQDLREVYDYHVNNGNDITIVAAVKSLRIPYGVIHTAENGIMTSLEEKPEHTFMINTGVYILQPELIDEIPEGEFFHITDLIAKVRSRGGKVGCFPVSDKAWTDIGDWDEYIKLVRK